MAYIPCRGDVVWLKFDPQPGHEQAGRRPVLVISPAAYNTKTGLFLACPITSQIKRYAFEVGLPAGLPVDGVVLEDQLKSLDWRVIQAEYICTLPAEITDDVIAKALTLLN